MNEHLSPVFEVLLPGLERADIECWVYGKGKRGQALDFGVPHTRAGR
jgi:hypothetical protein